MIDETLVWSIAHSSHFDNKGGSELDFELLFAKDIIDLCIEACGDDECVKRIKDRFEYEG